MWAVTAGNGPNQECPAYYYNRWRVLCVRAECEQSLRATVRIEIVHRHQEQLFAQGVCPDDTQIIVIATDKQEIPGHQSPRRMKP